MEEILLRFDHLGKQIFARLDNEKLANSREAGRAWKNFIDNENLPWNRIVVQKFGCQNGETPLHVAAKTGQIEQYKSISEDQEDKNPKDNYGYTPLHCTVLQKLDKLKCTSRFLKTKKTKIQKILVE